VAITDDQFNDLVTQVTALGNQLSSVQARTTNLPGGQCSAARPHVGKLIWQRGPNEYACECGKVYTKDGKGGLRE